MSCERASVMLQEASGLRQESKDLNVLLSEPLLWFEFFYYSERLFAFSCSYRKVGKRIGLSCENR